MDTGTGKNRCLVDMTMLAKSLGSNHATAVMGLHTYTDDDCNAAFKGKWKVTPLKKLQKYPRFQKAFKQLKVEWEVKAYLDEDE